MTSKIPSYVVSESVPCADFWFWLSVQNKRQQIAFFGVVANQILQKQSSCRVQKYVRPVPACEMPYNQPARKRSLCASVIAILPVPG